jgi:phosphoenolpyruvate-protein kinase (PTS system EI component)
MSEADLFKADVLVRSQGAVAPVVLQAPKEDGFILLTSRLSPHDYETINRSQGIICEEGGSSDHASVICRILGKTLLRLDDATSLLNIGDRYSIDGQDGEIRSGLPEHIVAASPTAQFMELAQTIDYTNPSIQVSIVGEEQIKQSNGAGFAVGAETFFLRSELIWASQGLDPFKYLSINGIEKTSDIIAHRLQSCVDELRPGQTINLRSLDWRPTYPVNTTDHNAVEPNPELGLHGIRKLLVDPDMLVAELRALEKVNSGEVIFSLPFITTSDELVAAKHIAEKNGINDIRWGIFVETAAAVSEIEDFIDQGIDLINIGTKDLTQMILACDRNNTNVQHLYDPTKKPVIKAINAVLKSGSRNQVPVFVFSTAEDLESIFRLCPDINGISICAGEYMQIAKQQP